jgi:hypothetical protein
VRRAPGRGGGAEQRAQAGACVRPGEAVQSAPHFDMGDPGNAVVRIQERVDLTSRLCPELADFGRSVTTYAYGVAKQGCQSGGFEAQQARRVVVHRGRPRRIC